MSDTAIDYDRQNALNNARNAAQPNSAQFHDRQKADNYDSQMPNTTQSRPSDLHIPSHGIADNHHSDQGRANALGDARENEKKEGAMNRFKNTANIAKTVAETATPIGALSLFKQIDFLGDMPFVAAIGAALLKDLLDSVAGPTVVLSILFSALCSIFIFMMLLLVGSHGKKKGTNNLLKKIGILGAGGIADSIPGIDFLPIETLTVAVIYFLTLVERKNASKG